MNLNELTENPAWNDEDKLAALLEQWADAYYNTGESPVDDALFDAARARMEILNPNNPIMAKVGAKVNVDGLERHKIPMGSLDKLNNEQDLLAWWKKMKPKEVVVQLKYDGFSLSLEYEDGVMKKGLSRGCGIFGENLTDNVKNSYNREKILTLAQKFTGSVRGEGIIFKEDFNAKNFPGESNPRNSSVGAIRKSNSPRAKWVRTVCYDLAGQEFSTEVEKLEYMKELGLPVSDYMVFDNPEDLNKYYNGVEANRDKLPYSIDGLVIKINDVARQKELGEHKGRPRHSIAMKFSFMNGEGKVTKIILSLGHSGAIIPTAEYEPITIDGRNFTHALLDNFDTIEKLGLAIGDICRVSICGDIIPKIDKVIVRSGNPPYRRPTKCPVCSAPVKIDGAATKCTNKQCPARQIATINNWITKTGIKYFGESRQQECFQSGIITKVSDLYTVTKEALGAQIGNGNAGMVMGEINKYRELPLNVFMGSLGIPFLGRSNASKLIAAGIDTLDKFLSMDPKKTKIQGFGDNLAEIAKGIKDCKDTINELLDSGVKIQEVSATKEVAGSLSFCFTGIRIGSYKSKFDAKGWVEKSGVSKKLNYLVAKDPGSASGKAQDAREMGITILSWQEFLKMLEE